MTSPIPPGSSPQGAAARGALSPSTKIFAASTTLLIGAAVAAAFWRPSLDWNENPLMDRQLVSAPLPDAARPLKEAPIPELSEMQPRSAAPTGNEFAAGALPSLALPLLEAPPTLDAGHAKYAQVFPPPILAEDEVPRKPSSRKNGRADGRAEGKTVSEQKFQPVAAEFDRIHERPPAPPKTLRPNSDFSKRPESASSVELSDALLPFFHAVENLRPLTKQEEPRRGPENPFQTAPATVEVTNWGAPAPLRPLPSANDSLTELKPLRDQRTVK